MKKLTTLIILFALSFTVTYGQLGIHAYTKWNTPTPSEIFQNKDINCVNIAKYWKNLNPLPGIYNWESLDNELDSCILYNKFIGISIAAGDKSPQWVKDQCIVLKFTEYRHRNDNQTFDVYIPVPWDTAYLNRWGVFIDTLAKHLKSNSQWYNAIKRVNCSGVSMSTCEWRLPNQIPSPETPLATNSTELWKSVNYTGTKIIRCFKKCRTYWMKAFPDKKLVFCFLKDSWPNNVDSVNVNDSIVSILSKVYNPKRYIVLHTSLTTNTSGTYLSTYKNLGLYTAYQTNESVFADPPCLTDTTIACNDTLLNQAIDIAINLDAYFIELQLSIIQAYPAAVKRARIAIKSRN